MVSPRTKAWGFALCTRLRIAVSFIGSANPFAFRDMVRKDTGSTGGRAKTDGKEKRKTINKRKKENREVRMRNEFFGTNDKDKIKREDRDRDKREDKDTIAEKGKDKKENIAEGEGNDKDENKAEGEENDRG